MAKTNITKLMGKYSRILIWFMCFILALDKAFELVSSPSTIENILGFVTIYLILYISATTVFFTKIKNLFKFTNKKNKHEKSN